MQINLDNTAHELIYRIFQSSFGERTLQRSKDLVQQLESFAECIFDEWLALVPGLVSENVAKSVFTTANPDQLRVNYTGALNELMEEARQMNLLGKTLPKTLQHLADRSESLWTVRAKLYELCDDYNDLKRTTNEHELKLLDGKLQLIETIVDQCCVEYTWAEFNMEDIENVHKSMRNLHGQTKEIQMNISTVLKGIDKWGETPFYDRKDRNAKELLDLQHRLEILKSRRMECEKSKRQLGNAIEKNRQSFEVDQNSMDETFVEYLRFIDGEVLNSLKWVVYQNLMSLRNEMIKNGTEPLFEIKVLSKDSEMVFSPGLEDPLDRLREKSETFIGRIEMIIDDFCSMAELIPRVREDKEESFMVELRGDEDIQDVKHDIRMSVLKLIKDVHLYVRKFEKYKFLWTTDKGTMMSHVEEPKMDEFRENVRE